MATLLLSAATSQKQLTTGREAREAVDDRAASSTASRPALSAWACGLDSADGSGADRCRDIRPELMVELL